MSAEFLRIRVSLAYLKGIFRSKENYNRHKAHQSLYNTE